MKHLMVCLMIVTSLGLAQASTSAVRLNDILLLSQRGVSDETILVFLRNREVGFTLDADDIDELLLAGLSEKVIRYLLQRTARTVSYASRTVTYTYPYPTHYYRPHYTDTSLFFGFSPFLRSSFQHHRYSALHHYRPRHTGAAHTPHNNTHRLTHIGGSNPAHVAATAGHSIPRARHGTSSASHRSTSASHSTPSASHRSTSASHSTLRTGHRSTRASHSTPRAGHRSISANRGGHSFGGHGGSHGSGH